MKRDNEWKKRMEGLVKPLTEERMNRLLLERYGGYIWKGIVAVLGVLAALGIIISNWGSILKILRR